MSQPDPFLEDLRRALASVPKPIADGAVQYYAEYFADARQAGVAEDEILRRTGTVDQIAGAIKDDLAIAAAEARPGPVRLLRLSRRLLGHSGRESRKFRMVGAARAARGTSLAVVSILPLAIAIILYLAAFAVLAGTVAIALAIAVNLTSHPLLAMNDRIAQIGLIAGLAGLGLLVAMLVQRAGHAFGRLTLSLFRRIASHPRPAAANRQPAAEPAAPGQSVPAVPYAEPAPVIPADPAAMAVPESTPVLAVPPARPAPAAPARSTVAAFAKDATTARAATAASVRQGRRQGAWRFMLVALLVIAMAGLTLSAFYGLPQAYFRLWNSQQPAGVQPVSQVVSDRPVRKLVIRTLNSNVVVQPSSSRNIHYRYEQLPYFESEERRAILDNAGNLGEFAFIEKSNGRLPLIELLSVHEGTTVLTINLPVDAELELEVHSNGGDIDIQVPSRTLTARTRSGDIRIHGRQQAAGDQVASSRGTVTWFS